MLRVLLGLGSNLGESEKAFTSCLGQLAEEGSIVEVSRLWLTRPVGPRQPDFLNAAVVIEWPMPLRSLLTRCQELETAAGRDRPAEERWGPRTLDLDLLLAANLVCRGPNLELPHPRFHGRRFALEPASEVAPEWTHPLLGCTITELVRGARDNHPDDIISVSPFDTRGLAEN